MKLHNFPYLMSLKIKILLLLSSTKASVLQMKNP